MFQFFCVVCGAWTLDFTSSLCRHCKDKVNLKKPLLHYRWEGETPHFFLFRWDEESDHFCKPLIYYLKKRGEDYFKEWATYYLGLSSVDPPALVCPSSSNPNKRQKNHAESFSLALEKQNLGRGVIQVEVSQGEKTQAQKSKSRKERFEGVGKSETTFVGDLSSKWIFVDDVLVSGGTFYKVKGRFRSQPFAILTLFYRPYLG